MKVFRKVVTLVVTMVMAFTMVESASAAEFPWTATKVPGNTGAGVAYKDVPLCKGEMGLRLDATSGGCSYLVAGIVSYESDLYWINNSNKNVKLTEIGGEQKFYMAFSTAGYAEDYMTYKCTVEHRGHGRIHLLVDHHGGGQTAGTQAGDGLNGEQHIVGGVLFLAQAQFLPQGFQNRGGVADVTGGAVADLDDVLALGFKGEVFVEGGDGVGFGFGDTDFLCHVAQKLGGQVAVFRLNVLHNGDQRPGIPDVPGDDLVRFAVVGRIQHDELPPCGGC